MTKATSQNQLRMTQRNRASSAQVMGVCVIGSVLICCIFMLASMSVWTLIGLVVLTALLIAKSSFTCVVCILALCLGQRLAVAWSYGIWQMTLVPGDLLFVIGVLGFTASSLKYISLDRQRFRWQGSAKGDVSHQEVPPSKESPPALLHPLSFDLLRLTTAIALSRGTLAVFSQDLFWPNLFRFDPAVLRMIVVAWTLVVFVGIPASGVSLLRWRKLDAAQAEVYLRSELSREVGREQRQVERALARTTTNARKNRWLADVADHS